MKMPKGDRYTITSVEEARAVVGGHEPARHILWCRTFAHGARAGGLGVPVDAETIVGAAETYDMHAIVVCHHGDDVWVTWDLRRRREPLS